MQAPYWPRSLGTVSLAYFLFHRVGLDYGVQSLIFQQIKYEYSLESVGTEVGLYRE